MRETWNNAAFDSRYIKWKKKRNGRSSIDFGCRETDNIKTEK